MTHQGDRIESKLDQAHRKLDRILQRERIQTIQGEIIMALDQEIFDAIAAQNTVVDGMIEYVKGLIEGNVISAAEGQKMLADIKTNNAKLEATLLEGVPVPPTT